MKTLQNLGSEVDIGHEYIVDQISKLNEKMHREEKEDDSTQIERMDGLRNILLNDIEDVIDKKLKYINKKKKLSKDEIEGFGVRFSMYLRKVAEGLLKQGNPHDALIMTALNKILALELEEMFASYIIEINILKRDSDKIAVSELVEEKENTKHLEAVLKMKQAEYKDSSREAEYRIENLKQQNQELQQQLREKEAYTQNLLEQIKAGLNKPLPPKSLTKLKYRMLDKKTRKYSFDLNEVYPQKDLLL